MVGANREASARTSLFLQCIEKTVSMSDVEKTEKLTPIRYVGLTYCRANKNNADPPLFLFTRRFDLLFLRTRGMNCHNR